MIKTPETTILNACQSDRTLGELIDMFPDCRYAELSLLVQQMIRSGTLQKFVDPDNECFVYRTTEEGCKVLESAGAIELTGAA